MSCNVGRPGLGGKQRAVAALVLDFATLGCLFPVIPPLQYLVLSFLSPMLFGVRRAKAGPGRMSRRENWCWRRNFELGDRGGSLFSFPVPISILFYSILFYSSSSFSFSFSFIPVPVLSHTFFGFLSPVPSPNHYFHLHFCLHLHLCCIAIGCRQLRNRWVDAGCCAGMGCICGRNSRWHGRGVGGSECWKCFGVRGLAGVELV